MNEEYIELINNPRPELQVDAVLLRESKSSRKTIVAIPQNGLGDRIKLLASCLYFCEKKDINLIVSWAKNCGGYSSCCSIFDIFQSRFLKQLKESPKIKDGECIITGTENPKKKLEKHDIVWMCGFSFIDTGFPADEAMKFLYTFLLERVSPKIMHNLVKYKTKNYVGVHIRRGDLCENNEQQYRVVPEEDFFSKVDKSEKVFLCTEDLKVRDSFSQKYGSNLMFLEDAELNRNTVKGTMTALTEMILLSRCRKILCSPSGFSEVSSLFSGAKREIVYPSYIYCFFSDPNNKYVIKMGLAHKCLYCGKTGKRDETKRICSAAYDQAQENQRILRASALSGGMLWGGTNEDVLSGREMDAGGNWLRKKTA